MFLNDAKWELQKNILFSVENSAKKITFRLYMEPV